MPPGPEFAVGIGYSVTWPLPTVIRAILPAPCSVNQTLPSAPALMAVGLLATVGIANCVIVPDGVIWPTSLIPASVNQTFPSGPAAIRLGPLAAIGSVYSWKAPAVVMRPILLALNSVNHSASSGPTVIPRGDDLAVGIVYSLKPLLGR